MITEKGVGKPPRIEPRWPAILAVIAVVIVLALLSSRVRLFPFWIPYVVVMGLLLPMIGVWLSGGNARWRHVERVSTLIFSVLVEGATLTTVLYLSSEMLSRPADFSGIQLLTTSIGAWITNILAFSMVYWQLDRGGPEARVNEAGKRPDWLFPQTGAPGETPPGWYPMYADYLYLSFSTAAAFSATDVMPLTRRAKMLMMIESAVSLSTLVVVASRAINLLGA